MADITRLEQFLNHIAHPEDPIPAPQTRLEQNLVEIAENKGGGGGGVFVVTTSSEDGAVWTTASATATEILAALEAGKLPVLVGSAQGSVVVAIYATSIAAGAAVVFMPVDGSSTFVVDTQGAVTYDS